MKFLVKEDFGEVFISLINDDEDQVLFQTSLFDIGTENTEELSDFLERMNDYLPPD